MPVKLEHHQYTVGWVCALANELVAAQEMLDEEHDTPPCGAHDTNIYTCGQIGEHNVVIACLPEGRMGTTSAATVAKQMRLSFTSIRFGLMVGIGGGVPSDTADIRLGDVVVSKPDRIHGGVVQYDFGKALAGGFERTGSLDGPPTVLLNAVTNLRANFIRRRGVVLESLSKFDDLPEFTREAAGVDVLYLAHYEHAGGSTCKDCDISQTKSRPARKMDTIIHYGTIASGNKVMKNSTQRDSISAGLGGVLCFEMEAAGLMNDFPCLVVRGISDYADTHKNDQWQPFAAATAAAYARELLLVIPTADLKNARTIQATIGTNGDQRSSAIREANMTQLPRLRNESQSGPGITPAARECLRSLAFPEQEQRFLSIETTQHTCQWLLKDSQYQTWLASPRGLFLIKGHPGTGKSVLTKFAVNSLRKERPKDLIVSFFVHGQGNTLQRTALGIYRALLNSLLEQFPECLSKLTTTFEDRNKRYGNYEAGRWEWNVDELQDILSQVLKGYSSDKSVIVFIDALDECGEEIAKELLIYFNEQAAHDNAKVKVCISSRHYPVIGLENSPAVYMEERNAADISWYVRDRLKNIQSAPKRDLFEQSILRKAKGGFQWAFLVTGIMIDGNMNGVKVDKLQSKLASCPGGLGELYAAILQDFTGFEQRQMTKLFEWILFAERPLSAQELREALATKEDMSFRSISELREHDSWSDTLGDFEKHVKNLSKGLVEFKTRDLWEVYNSEEEDWNREAQLIHQSVADFLLDRFLKRDSGRENDESSALRGAIHFRISRSCLQYMFISEILDAAQLSRSTLSSNYPLISYVIRYGFEHIRKVEKGGITQNDLLEALHWAPRSSVTQKVATLWKTLDPECIHAPQGWPFLDASALHVLAACGSKSACFARLAVSNEEVDSLDVNGNTPLMLAIRDGHQAIALMLIDECEKRRYDRITIRDLHIGGELQIVRPNGDPVLGAGEIGGVSHSGDRIRNEYRRTEIPGDMNVANDDSDTALTIALDEQNSEVAVRLIQAGVKLEYLGDPSALVKIAVSSRDKAVLDTLIINGISLDGAMYLLIIDETPGDPCGLFHLVARLLQVEADCVNSLKAQQSFDSAAPQDDHYALIVAARRGMRDIVLLLILQGVSPMVQNKRGDTALMAAVQGRQREVVQLLLQVAPTSVNIEDKSGRTPVQAALWIRDIELVEMILSGGDFLDVRLTHHGLLLGASGHGLSTLAAKILREPGTDPNYKDTNGRTPLLLAARSGSVAIVNMLLEITEVNVDSRDKQERTPLMEAVLNGHRRVVKLLLSHGADPSSVCKDRSSPLIEAACKGNFKMVKLLVARGADVNYVGKHGTALASTFIKNNRKVAVLLIRNGANPNVKISEYGTVFIDAVMRGDIDMVGLMIHHGADVNAKGLHHLTNPLDYAISFQNKDMVELLLQNGANSHLGNTELHRALRLVLFEKDSRGNKDLAEVLFQYGADINARLSEDGTALAIAAKNNEQELVQFLLEKGAEPNRSFPRTGGALHFASAHGNVVVVNLLLYFGADVTASRNDGARPLHLAANRGHVDVAQMLLEHNADVNVLDGKGRVPLRMAIRGNHYQVIRLLLQNGADLTKENGNRVEELNEQLSAASRTGCSDEVEVSWAKGARCTADAQGMYPLHLASEQGHVAIVESLLGKGAYSGPNNYGWTPLHRAASRNNIEVVKILLKSGADVTSASSTGWTPLRSAAANGHLDVARLLLDADAEPDIINHDGWSPLREAAELGHVEMFQLFLDKGAQPLNGISELLEIAESNGHQGIVEIILLTEACREEDLVLKTRGSIANWLAFLGHTDLLKLVAEKWDGQLETRDFHRRNSLHLALRGGHQDTFQYLTSQGLELANPNMQDQSLIGLAASKSSKELLTLILDMHPNIDLHSRTWTPLHWACRAGNVDAIELLLARGWKSQIVDVPELQGRWTPYSIAVHHGRHIVQDLSEPTKIALGFNGTETKGHIVGAYCDGCLYDIYGPRFRCLVCNDFDYCFMCYSLYESSLHKNHGWNRIERPTYRIGWPTTGTVGASVRNEMENRFGVYVGPFKSRMRDESRRRAGRRR